MYQTSAVNSVAGIAYNPQFTIGATATDIRPAQVEEQTTALQINANDLTEIVSRLEAKLASVVQPQPNKDPNLKVPEPVLVPLASKLRDVCSEVRGSVDRLRNLCGAIELSE